MHNFLQFLSFFSGPIITFFGWYGFRQYNRVKKRNQLSELDDCPFPFTVEVGGGNWFIVVDFGDGMELWCDYSYGIREDGMYGVDWMKLEGWNRWYNTDIELKIGQSVFPLVERMEKLTDWLDAQAFEYEWDKALREKWDEMKKKLNNLRYLETKSKEKEKKQK